MLNLSRVAVLLPLLLFSYPIQSANYLDVVINEIAWMGGKVSPNDEWIELYNNTDSPINLDGWALKSIDGSPEIKLKGAIPQKNFYLLERTDDNTVPDILAGQIYTGALSNEGENLKLYDNFSNLIDSVDFSSGWLFGVNSTKQTVERIDSGNWQTSQNPGGTPKAKNSSPALIEIEPQSVAQKETKLIVYPSGIIFNEILPSPEGADTDEEWVEIFNQNNFQVDLSNWQISDTIGSIGTYAFPQESIIASKEYLVLTRPIIKITLNNSADGLKLIQPDGKIIDTLNYEKAPLGQSFNRTEAGWQWSDALTPGEENIIPGPTTIEENQKDGEALQLENEVKKENNYQKELAAISRFFQEKEAPQSRFILFIALTIAIFSGIAILILKRNLT